MSNMKQNSVPKRFLRELTNYCSSNPQIEKVVLFGSRARGDFEIHSDIDLALYTINSSHSDQNIMEYKIQDISTHLKIDIVFMDRLVKEGLIRNIERDGVILYEQGKAARKA